MAHFTHTTYSNANTPYFIVAVPSPFSTGQAIASPLAIVNPNVSPSTAMTLVSNTNGDAIFGNTNISTGQSIGSLVIKRVHPVKSAKIIKS